MSLLAFCSAVGVTVASVSYGVGNTEAAILTWTGAIALGAVAWFTLRSRTVVGLILVFGFIAFGMVASVLYRPGPADYASANPAVASFAHHTPSFHYLLTFVVAAFAVWVSTLIAGLLAIPQRPTISTTSLTLDISPKLLALATLPVVALIYGTGPLTLLHATAYLEHTGPAFAVSLGHAFGSVGVLVCGYFCFDKRQSGALRLIAALIASAYEVIFFATATRFFAFALPLMFVGGLLSGAWSSRQQKIGVALMVIVAIFALELPLGLRGLPEHGLVPGLAYVIHQPALVFGSPDPINNFLFGAPLTLYVADEVGRIPVSDLVVSLSPMPSQLNNWNAVAPSLRLNIYTPYSALGELLNQGWLLYVFVMGLFGAGFVVAEAIALKASAIRRGLGQLIVYGAAALFVVQSTEYNLRSSARLVYYAIAVVFVLSTVLEALMLHRAFSLDPAVGVGERAEPVKLGETLDFRSS